MKNVVAFLLFIFSFNTLIFAQDEEIIAEGTGLGANSDEALLAAKRNAIEKGIGTILLSQTEIENFMVKKDQIITKTMGSVKRYEKISETKTSDGLYEIRIKAVLSKSSLSSDLAAFHILIESMNKPRTMVIIQEINMGKPVQGSSAAETYIIKFLKDPYQFELIDPKVSESIRASQEKMAQISGDAAAAAHLGTQNGAEVIIVGKAESSLAEKVSQNLGGMVSAQADVTLRAINCTTGSIIGSSSGHGAMVHVSAETAGNQAITRATQKAIKELLDAIVKEWQNQQNNGILLSLTISGVTTFRVKNDIINTLSTLANVTGVYERNWDMQSKIFMVDVQYKGNANGFCTRIDGYKLKSGSGSIAVSGLNGLRISLIIQAM
jgi:hypothetical protein